MSDLPYWLALNRVSVLGARRISQLITAYGSAQRAFTVEPGELEQLGLPVKVSATFLRERGQINPQDEWQRCQRLGISILTLADEGYPQILREIYDPPVVLYYRGDISCLSQFSVAIVGSRKATAYGRAAAEKFAGELASAGVVIISGLARGIDSHAHLGALQANGLTAAVLGSGLDICYPPENRALREKIVQSGVVISEFPPGAQPKPAHFPMRNRIISGLSQATIVVEAAEKSGALITADCALEQGREVFAVPGSIHSPTSRGCHRLIKEGAAVAESAADVLQYLGQNVLLETVAALELTAVQALVISALEYEPTHFDQLIKATNLTAAELSSVLVELELAGFLQKLSGNFYLRV
ncbi:MAG TPA: DNA-processing protein DprA [Oscillospiraceae bacterium]|nr:DNA-processing protein DprA [Oscillospiraceae bacterium]